MAELPYGDRLLFIGLWTQADRAGRLEDRPKRIKAELFPYDDLNVDECLGRLANAGLVTRYEVNGHRLISIPTWTRHQVIPRDEPPSEFVGPNGETDTLGRAPNDTVRQTIYARDVYTCAYCGRDMQADARSRCVDHVVPLAQGGSHQTVNLVTACKRCNAVKGPRTPDQAGMTWPEGLGHTVNGGALVGQREPDRKGKEGIGKDQEGKGTTALRASFELWWSVYPRKVGKDAALAQWLRIQPEYELVEAMTDAVQRQAKSPQWKKDGGQFVPHPRTWLSQGRWKDSVDLVDETKHSAEAKRTADLTRQYTEHWAKKQREQAS